MRSMAHLFNSILHAVFKTWQAVLTVFIFERSWRVQNGGSYRSLSAVSPSSYNEPSLLHKRLYELIIQLATKLSYVSSELYFST